MLMMDLTGRLGELVESFMPKQDQPESFAPEQLQVFEREARDLINSWETQVQALPPAGADED